MPLLTYFPQRFQLGLHDELVLAELTAACVRTLDPLLQASLMHKMKASCAVTGGDQRAFVISFTVADPVAEDKLISGRRAHSREDGALPEGQFLRK